MSGTGSLAFALADAGLCKVKAAIDLDRDACKTFNDRARFRGVSPSRLPVAHVEDINVPIQAYQRKKMSGIKKWYSDYRKGSFDLIVGGLACGPWSRLNRNARAEDRTLILTLASYIEFFQPKVFILENVANFARYQKWKEDKNTNRSELETPVNALLAFLISFGYKVQHGILHAASHGVPQGRNRYFIIATSTMIPSPKLPTPTHFTQPTMYGLISFFWRGLTMKVMRVKKRHFGSISRHLV
ncbi:S-adenosyl-L-methionine-dependent methyltransferase [Chytridium lagenaria]|nr:S-adenosyl-L-methionine-dependent methyltransferase [Chytridium lagenaria]